MLQFPVRVFVKLGIAFAIFLACAIGFVALADEVLEGDTLWYDEAALLAIRAQSSELLDRVFLGVTKLGGVTGVLVLGLGFMALLWSRKKYRQIVLFAAGLGGAAIINLVLKSLFERARPDLWQQLVVETSFSFPSGHAMASMALALSVVFILWATRFRYFALILASLYVLVIGFSRLYLGVHYPTDIFGGWLVSAGWVLVAYIVLTESHRRRLKKRSK